MIDYSIEVFDVVARSLRSAFPGIAVKGEYVREPATFPTVTIDEIRNVPVHNDSSGVTKYAEVTYRVQVFTNSENKRAHARKIYDFVDELLSDLGLRCRSFTTTPSIYNAEVYNITTTHEGTVSADGVFYRG